MDENGVVKSVERVVVQALVTELLDLKDAAAYLGVSYETARLYVAAGKLTAVRFPKLKGEGRRRKIQLRRDELERFLEEARW